MPYFSLIQHHGIVALQRQNFYLNSVLLTEKEKPTFLTVMHYAYCTRKTLSILFKVMFYSVML